MLTKTRKTLKEKKTTKAQTMTVESKRAKTTISKAKKKTLQTKNGGK